MYLYARAPQSLPPGSARTCTRGQARQKRGLKATQSYVQSYVGRTWARGRFWGVAGIRADPRALRARVRGKTARFDVHGSAVASRACAPARFHFASGAERDPALARPGRHPKITYENWGQTRAPGVMARAR